MCSSKKVKNALKTSVGKECREVSVGGITIPDIVISIGKKIKFNHVSKNPRLKHVYPKHEGQYSFYIRCWWWLEHHGIVVTSSIDNEDKICSELVNLVGKTIVSVNIIKPVWDLILHFTDGFCLAVFSNLPDNHNDKRCNWHATTPQAKLMPGLE